jgi:hypothetical protein
LQGFPIDGRLSRERDPFVHAGSVAATSPIAADLTGDYF